MNQECILNKAQFGALLCEILSDEVLDEPIGVIADYVEEHHIPVTDDILASADGDTLRIHLNERDIMDLPHVISEAYDSFMDIIESADDEEVMYGQIGMIRMIAYAAIGVSPEETADRMGIEFDEDDMEAVLQEMAGDPAIQNMLKELGITDNGDEDGFGDNIIPFR